MLAHRRKAQGRRQKWTNSRQRADAMAVDGSHRDTGYDMSTADVKVHAWKMKYMIHDRGLYLLPMEREHLKLPTKNPAFDKID